jgi:hypothetical protein
MRISAESNLAIARFFAANRAIAICPAQRYTSVQSIAAIARRRVSPAQRRRAVITYLARAAETIRIA